MIRTNKMPKTLSLQSSGVIASCLMNSPLIIYLQTQPRQCWATTGNNTLALTQSDVDKNTDMFQTIGPILGDQPSHKTAENISQCEQAASSEVNSVELCSWRQANSLYLFIDEATEIRDMRFAQNRTASAHHCCSSQPIWLASMQVELGPQWWMHVKSPTLYLDWP